MAFIGSFADKFCKTFEKGTFFNIHLEQDISTVYHNEYNALSTTIQHYWCYPPAGFSVSCERIIGLFGKLSGVALAVDDVVNDPKYKIILKDPTNIPDMLIQLGLQIGINYAEHEIKVLIEKFLPDL